MQIREARSNLARRVILVVEVQLGFWLYDPSLRKQEIVGAGQPARNITAVADIKRRRELEVVRSQPFDAHRCPGALWTGIQINADASLRVKIAHMRIRAIIQRFMVATADRSVRAESLRFEPKFIHVRASPSLAVPAQFIVRAIGA